MCRFSQLDQNLCGQFNNNALGSTQVPQSLHGHMGFTAPEDRCPDAHLLQAQSMSFPKQLTSSGFPSAHGSKRYFSGHHFCVLLRNCCIHHRRMVDETSHFSMNGASTHVSGTQRLNKTEDPQHSNSPDPLSISLPLSSSDLSSVEPDHW